MNIIKARNEIVILGNYIRKNPIHADTMEWERMQYLRTFILIHKQKHNGKEKNNC